jgi:hypothetical protein
MRIRVRKFVAQGMAGGYEAARVTEIADGEPLPEGAEKVAPDTPISSWTPFPGEEADQAASVKSGRTSGRKES